MMGHGNVALMLGVLLTSSGCSSASHEGRDNSSRIDESMRPDSPSTPLPEGIALGQDAPPLAPVLPGSPNFVRGWPCGGTCWGYEGCSGGLYRGWSGPPVRFHVSS